MAESGEMNKPGIAFIVSNSYDCSGKLEMLKGAHKDAEKMVEVFTQLRYEVVARKNLTYDELIKFISEAAALPYTPSYKRLVFSFSGHGVAGETLYDRRGRPRGNASGRLCSQEGREIEIESIIDQFSLDKHPALQRMARLFFFDVCRGTEEDVGVALQSRGMSERGGQFLLPERVPKGGNILVAYSTLPNHKAYKLSSGSLWMRFLTEAILNQNDDIATILTDVSSRVLEEFKSRRFPLYQTPQCINQLIGRVNFLGELLAGNLCCKHESIKCELLFFVFYFACYVSMSVLCIYYWLKMLVSLEHFVVQGSVIGHTCMEPSTHRQYQILPWCEEIMKYVYSCGFL